MSQELNPQGYNYGVDPVNINPFWEEGGGGGSDDYNDLRNQPQINGVTLSGNKTTEQLRLNYTLPTASANTKGGVKIGSGLTMTGDVLSANQPTPYELPTASENVKGGVKIGSGLTMDGEVLSANQPTPYELPTASANVKGGVKIGSGLTMTGDVLSANQPTPYELPTASANVKGGVKIGSGLAMNGDVLSTNVPDPTGQSNYQVIGTRNGAYQLFDPDTLVRTVPSGNAGDVGKVLTKYGDGSKQYGWVNAKAVYTDYSNTSSGLQATTVQGAIDELASSGGGSNVPDPTSSDENKFLVAGYDDDAGAVVPMWGNGRADKVRYSKASGSSFPSSVKYVNAALDVLDVRSQKYSLNAQTTVPYSGGTSAYELSVYDGGDIFDSNVPAKFIGIDVSFAAELSSGLIKEFAIGHAEFDPQFLVNSGYRETDAADAIQAVVTIPVSRVYDSNNAAVASADSGSYLTAYINFNTKDSNINSNIYSAVLAGIHIEANVKVSGLSVYNIAADSQLDVRVYKQVKRTA